MANSTQKILLIEDDQLTRELYERELSWEYQVLACANESEAVAYLHDQQICAIVLEPVMRSGQGWTFLERLRSTYQLRNTPIILCSILDERRKGVELGATLCLIKPVLPITLRTSIRQVLNSPISN